MEGKPARAGGLTFSMILQDTSGSTSPAVQQLLARLMAHSPRVRTAGSLQERPGPESTAAYYRKQMGRPELSYVSAAEYLERRALFIGLTQLAPFEHPALAIGREIRDGVPARCLVWHPCDGDEEEPTTAEEEARRTAVETARRQIRDAVVREFDSVRGWPAEPTVRSITQQREQFVSWSLARRPIDTRFLLEPMYLDGAPVRRLDLLDRLAMETPAYAAADGEAERIEAMLDARPLYWEQARIDDLPVWRIVCEWIAGRPGAAATGEQLHALFAQEEQHMPDPLRIAAVGLIYFIRGRGRSGWAQEGYHLTDGWRTRLRTLEAIYKARSRA